jgi:para-aminobenzoate synthetase component 1
MFLGLYPGALVIDHLEDTVYLTDANFDHKGKERINDFKLILENSEQGPFLDYKYSKGPVESNFSKENYLLGIQKVKDYIRSGDIYQANFTQRFTCMLESHPFELYQELRKKNPAPFSSYIDFDTGYVCSSSPERFIKVRKGKIQTRPIKGTMPRYKDPIKDDESKKRLINSKKDQSELLMIVDLERNDLSKIAQTGSVKVPELFKLESYETVHHLVATVEANIDPKYSITDVIKATFPGGSITGTPKIRAMEVIDELEPTARGLYTGSIGYIDFNQNLDLNIVIRTFICKNNQAYFQAGGGIVWDSSLEGEYQESLDKAIALKNTLIGEQT